MRACRGPKAEYGAVAIYHLSVKPISRSAGRSATAAAAYRAGALGVAIVDQRTGDVHDYTRKRGVQSADIVLPDGAAAWALDRPALWNAAELAERRKDACVAREYEVALPAELPAEERRRLALDFAKDMANREGCAVDVCIHEPGRGGDHRNHHAHILRTTRRLEGDRLGAKLDTEKAGRHRAADLEAVRARWAELTNERLRAWGSPARVDHRSLVEQGVERVPTKHLGPAATGFERRTGLPSETRIRQEEASQRLVLAKEAGELERQGRQVDGLILDLTGNIDAARKARDAEIRRQMTPPLPAAPAGPARPPGGDPVRPPQTPHGDEDLKRRIDAMSAAQFRAAIERIRPPPVAELVEIDPDVRAAEDARAALADRMAQLQAQGTRAQLAAQVWRQQHPLKAKMHDAGVLRVDALTQYDQVQRQVQREIEQVYTAQEVADQQVQAQRGAAELRIAAATAPAHQRVSEFEALLQAKLAGEQGPAMVRVLDSLAARRAARAAGFTDSSAEWVQATPPALREVIERYNAQPPDVRAQLLQSWARDPEKAGMLARLINQRHAAVQGRAWDLSRKRGPDRDQGR